MLELPPYRRPVARVLLRNTWRQVRAFLVDAGTIILALTIIVWALLNYPRDTRSRRACEPSARHDWTSAVAAADAARRARRGRAQHARRPAAAQRGRPRRPADRAGARAARLRLAHRRRHSRRVRRARGVRLDDGHRVRHRRTPTSRTSRCAMRCAARQARRRDAADDAADGRVADGVLRARVPVHEHAGRGAPRVGLVAWPAFMFAYQTVLAYAGALVVYQGGRLLGFS